MPKGRRRFRSLVGVLAEEDYARVNRRANLVETGEGSEVAPYDQDHVQDSSAKIPHPFDLNELPIEAAEFHEEEIKDMPSRGATSELAIFYHASERAAVDHCSSSAPLKLQEEVTRGKTVSDIKEGELITIPGGSVTTDGPMTLICSNHINPSQVPYTGHTPRDLYIPYLHGFSSAGARVRPSEECVCESNRNPAEFGSPEAGNRYTIAGTDLKTVKKLQVYTRRFPKKAAHKQL